MARAAALAALALAGLAALGGGVLAPAPASARPLVGIADQAPGVFSDPRFTWLRMRTARLVVPWDVARHPDEQRRADAWLRAARSYGVAPLVVFDRSSQRPRYLPTIAEYRNAVGGFMRRNPWVRDYSPWDEENHYHEPTARDPHRAAAYFNELSRLARRCRSCEITAADVLDEPNMESWVRAFLRYARHPRLWGLHNYYDLNYGSSQRTALLLRLVHGEIWFTETGDLVWRYDKTARRFVVRSEGYAARAAGRLLALAALSPRIKRIYYYHWRVQVSLGFARRHPGTVTWDSGLLRPDCTARQALSVIARDVGRNPATMPRAVLDRSGDCVAPPPPPLAPAATLP